MGTREIRDLGNCCGLYDDVFLFPTFCNIELTPIIHFEEVKQIVTNLQITWRMGEGCGVLFHEMPYTGVMPNL